MANKDMGNIIIFDTNGAVRSSDSLSIQKFALWGVDGTGEMTVAMNGTTILKLGVVVNGTNESIHWVSESFNPPLYLNNLSVTSVTAGTGYIYTA